MQLLVVRHAIAADPGEASLGLRDDAQRPLTDDGRKKMARGAKGLRRAVKALDVLATSPLVRARQTADILAEEFDGQDVVTVDELVPGQTPSALGRWLGRQKGERVAVVGHEPHLSGVVSWLLTGSDRPILELRKGGACLLELGDDVAPGRALLLWSLRPRQLRALAE